ncbi:tetratricopeptide repeat protein [Zoogloea sp.]|uniref:tetratricopeptide repeat protein n=1 Tax=Zoogloea sp. TaxID=49181 RepID=UPI0026182B12|nr:tetratricopeptide repeat protein [uncultured Zoogloea sp.]
MKPDFRRLRPARLIASLFLAAGLQGLAHAEPEPDAAAPAAGPAEAAYPAQELTPQILYQLMLAEVAGARGQVSLAAQSYLDLARRTRDARIARRAAELAIFARQADLVTEASRLWLDLEPGSERAQQLTAGAMTSAARIDELQAQLAKALATQGERIGGALLGLNRGLARIPDKVLIRRLVNQLTEPYLDHPEAHFARANAAYVAGDPAGASAAIDGALALRPDWEQAVILRAQLQQEQSPGAGVGVLRDYLAVHPEAREPRLTLARLLVAGRQFGPAREQFEILLQRSPDDRDVVHAVALLAMQQGDWAVAEKQFKRLLELGHSEPDTLRMYLGQIADQAKRPDDAIAWYKAVGPGGQYVMAQGRIAQLLAAGGKMAEARQHLQAAAREVPAERAQYALLESQLLRDGNRSQDAFDVLDAALRAEPENPELLYESALMAERVGRIEVMEGRLRKLIALKPDHAHAYNALGYSLADRKQRLDEAEALVRKGLALTPEDPFIIDSLGWVLYRRGELAGALEQLQKAFGLRADPEIAAHLGEVLWMLGRRDEAARVWKDAAKANPDNPVLADVIKKFKP